MKLTKSLKEKGERLLRKFPNAIEYLGKGEFSVASETGAGRYRVNDMIDRWTCECRFFREEEEICKHIAAVLVRQEHLIDEVQVAEDTIQSVSCTQDWETYDLAQKAELKLFDPLLRDLVANIADPRQTRATGRPRTEFSTDLFCTIRKVASMYSCRRSYGFLERATENEMINFVPNYSISSRLLVRKDVTPILKDLVSFSSLPLAALEDRATVAIDSSGFRTTAYGFYCQEKHGPTRKNIWLKSSILVGCETHGVFRASVTQNNIADVNLFPELLTDALHAGFDIGTAVADKGYLSRLNFNVGSNLGVDVIIPFKSDSIPMAKGSPGWKKMYYLFTLNRDEFDRRYHVRSNVESVFAAIKTKFGETIKSKNPTAQVNEAYCKIIAYNISVVIHEIFKRGISFPYPPDTDTVTSGAHSPYLVRCIGEDNSGSEL